MVACWLALRAVRRVSPTDAFVAGMLAMTAVGLKQSIVGGLVFGGVLLVGSGLSRELTRRDTVRCAAAATAGAAVPVLVVVGWALTVGVRLETLWYAVVTFRSDASAVIASQDAEGATGRIWLLVLVFVGTGMALLLLWFLVRVRDLLRHDLVATVAVVAMVRGGPRRGRGQRQLLAPLPLRAHPRRGAGPGTPADRRRAPLAGPPARG